MTGRSRSALRMPSTAETGQPLAVVMGLSPTGLHVVRVLGRAGVRVVGVASGFQSGRASRYLHHCITAGGTEERLAALCGLVAETPQDHPGRAVLIPTSDQDVDFVIAHAAQLTRYFSFQAAYRDGLASQIMTKDSFYQLCSDHGVASPRLWRSERSGLAELLHEVSLPCMIKPSRIHDIKDLMQGRKGWVIQSLSELDAVLAEIPTEAGVLLVQEIVPGPESSITLACSHVAADGRQHQTFTARKLRQYPPGFGSASLVQSSHEPESARIMADFLKAVGYRGVAAAEFKRHPDTGILQMIEINVRPSLWFSITEAAGRHVVLAAYCELAGSGTELPDLSQREGVRWRYGIKDLWSAYFYRRNPDFVLPAPDIEAAGPEQGRTWAVFSPDDPAPVVYELINFLWKAVARTLGLGRGTGSKMHTNDENLS